MLTVGVPSYVKKFFNEVIQCLYFLQTSFYFMVHNLLYVANRSK